MHDLCNFYFCLDFCPINCEPSTEMQFSKIFSVIYMLHTCSIQTGFAEILLSTPLLGTLSGSVTKTAWTSKPIYQFLGVKYARSPSGELRFQKPVLAIPWPGYHNVQKVSRRCPYWFYIQGLSADELAQDLEDCLRLNIYSTNVHIVNEVFLLCSTHNNVAV